MGAGKKIDAGNISDTATEGEASNSNSKSRDASNSIGTPARAGMLEKVGKPATEDRPTTAGM
jgi:hypothetical protein